MTFYLATPQDTHGTATGVLHWIIAAATTSSLATGFAASALEPVPPELLRAHAAFGTAAGVFALIRLFKWLSNTAPRKTQPGSTGLTRYGVRLVHASLRFLPLILVVSGMGMVLVSGNLPALVEGRLSGIADGSELPPRQLHTRAAAVLLGLLALHVTAAIWHRFGSLIMSSPKSMNKIGKT